MISFDEKKHEYRVGGIVTPSVSQILQANGLFSNFRKNETKLTEGTAIHKTLELHNLKRLDYRTLDKRLMKCVELWDKFQNEIGIVKVIESEKRVNSGVLYAGTIDKVCQMNDGKTLILDYKSGNPQPWAALQTAGYSFAYDPNHFREHLRCCLKIHWDMDRPIYKPYKDANDYNVFFGMATTYHWKKNNGYLKEDGNDL